VADSFEHFFKHQYREIEQRVRAAGAASDVAAEATQEAFVRAYQRWWRVGHYRNPAAWVQRVALNHRIDIERKGRRESALVTTMAVQAAGGEAALDPEIEAAVDSLPPQQQAAVRAVYTNGMSATETADELGISAGAVRFHLNRARNTLRPMLTPDTASQEV
jgi:RNA polymerase sigma-70 factor (ECF subfamily)